MEWDDKYEASPADTDEAKYGAREIRRIKTNTSEREELEHNFKTGTRPFHKRGECSMLYVGSAEDIDALTGMTAGCIAYDTAGKFKRYDGSSWLELSGLHDNFVNRDENDHPQYLQLDAENQMLETDLTVTGTIDGRDMSADATNVDGSILQEEGPVKLTFSGSTITSGTVGVFDDLAVNDTIYTSSALNRGPFLISEIDPTETIITVTSALNSEGPVEGVVIQQREGFGAWTGSYNINQTYSALGYDVMLKFKASNLSNQSYISLMAGTSSANEYRFSLFVPGDNVTRVATIPVLGTEKFKVSATATPDSYSIKIRRVDV